MVAERVPRQLADESMILVEIGALVGEDEIRGDASLQRLEQVLDSRAVIRKETVAELDVDDHCRGGEVRGGTSALARASSPRTSLASARPSRPRASGRARQPEDRPAAADLDVVAVSAERENRGGRRLANRGVSITAGGCGLRGADLARRIAALERARRAILSFSVSIGSQNPSYGYAMSSPRPSGGAAARSTRSSPSWM